MKIIQYFFLFGFLSLPAIGQKVDYRISSGFIFGAPIPDRVHMDSRGWPGIMPQAGVEMRFKISNPLQLSLGVLLSPKFARFSSSFSDVILEEKVIWIAGVPVDTAWIETFFSGKARGSFRNTYLEIPVRLELKTGKWQIGAGPFLAPLLYASNKVVAEGVVGFSVPPDSTTRRMNHANLIRRWDYGISLAASYKIFRKTEIYLHYHGSLPHIYSAEVEGLDGKLRNMNLSVGLNWSFSKRS